MAEPAPPAPGVCAEVADEETHGAQLAPLAHVHELVGDQVTVMLVTTPQQEPTAERHARDPGRQHGHAHEAGAIEIAHRDMRELLALTCFEPPWHGRLRR
jgi:hypothetical protein